MCEQWWNTSEQQIYWEKLGSMCKGVFEENMGKIYI